MAHARSVARTLLAIFVGTFAAGALVNVRLRAVTALGMDLAGILGQGLEVAAIFSPLVAPACWAAWLLVRRIGLGGRPLVALLAYGMAVVLLMAAFGREDPVDVALDGYAHLYLAAGALAAALAAPPPAKRAGPTGAGAGMAA